MYCKNCGAQIPSGAGFCPSCGAPVKNAANTHNTTQPASQSKSGGSGIVAVVVVIIAILACYTFLTHDKQQTQLAQIQAEQQQVQQEAEEKKAAEEKEAAEKEEEEKKAAEEKEAEEKEEAASASEPTTINNYYYYNTGNPPGDYYTDVKSSGYLWPTDTQYITSSDLSGFDKDTVAAIRNEIYARHGYAFQQTRWQEYFAAKSWYYRDESCTESTVSSRLNSVEKTNIDTIVKYEKSMGWR